MFFNKSLLDVQKIVRTLRVGDEALDDLSFTAKRKRES